MDILIRIATENDVVEITKIYNHAIVHTTATFDTEEKTVENRTNWLKQHCEKYPVIVATDGQKILGWGSLSLWSDKCAYSETVENSIYVHPNYRGKGIGKQLLEDLISRAKKNSLHVILARISEGNENSIHIHKQFGFECAGVLKQVGKKFGRLIDVHMYQLILN